jgi:methionyl-tRNA formyltransferase
MTRRIIFMGTPAFAVGTLNALVEAGHNVAAVITAPDKPAGRGRQPRASAVKERALELGLPLLQPERLRDPGFIAELDRINADLYVVVAFRMLPEVVWNKPPLGTINLHASLLPQYRGAAPINWAVINGERTTGLTTFKLQHAIDTGDILLQQTMDIGPDETAGELHDRMMVLGARLVVRTVDGLFAGTLHGTPQSIPDGTPLRSAPKLTPENTRIDVQAPAQRIHDLVRGLSPFPGAWCRWTDATGTTTHFKVLRTEVLDIPATRPAGSIDAREGSLVLHCSDRLLRLVEVQAEGRRRMYGEDFLRGLRDVRNVALA